MTRLAWCFVCQGHVPEGHSSDVCRDRIAANRAKSLAVLDAHPAPIPDTPVIERPS